VLGMPPGTGRAGPASVLARGPHRGSQWGMPKVVAFHDDRPREETGKMCKRKLRAPFWEKAGRSL
jgi:hypothetical protein